ncbi:GMC family oxidoreductase [Bradyrhizobium lablabi]|uniref:GMC family oxidoreductase n=1 Tax=Bradyrhizobium lablabi TaxID=722472 RepID=UPI001BA66471|nr:GMC family oxidoreductase N-terminal domain-containing protein [Bradyrhizobium lablabi]MBR0692696.1 GMC family oxidoreductase N-terminal domain-containing protein [Bradyrhizobium lablabi]
MTAVWSEGRKSGCTIARIIEDVPRVSSGKSSVQDCDNRAPALQLKAPEELKADYDFVVCGSGSSGSVVAGRLSADPSVNVLLLEAGGTDDVPAVMDASLWLSNLGSERDWNFVAQPNPHLNGRAILQNMGKVLGGGSSINLMGWVRGHKNDWDYFAAEARDPAWSHQSILDLYRRIEDWHGTPEADYRGSGGPVFIRPARASPVSLAFVEGARAVGMPTFETLNGRLMESQGGCSRAERINRAGKRQSIFRSYVAPHLARTNLTVVTHALVTRVILDGRRAVGIEIIRNGKVHRISAGREIILSMGAIHTPKVLMQSGIGDESELRRLNIPVVQHLPGVGQNFQDHFLLEGCVWEARRPLEMQAAEGEALFFWKSDPHLETPDIQALQLEGARTNPQTSGVTLPTNAWTIYPGIVRPKSRGRLRLTGPGPNDPMQIEANTLSHPDDMKAMMTAVEICRGIAHSAPLRSFVKREVIPGSLKGRGLEQFLRNSVVSYWHQSCTAKMGTDDMSVVDGRLRVYGIDNLRIADASIMPRVTTGNTMAPCVVIGERASDILAEQS